MSPKQSREVGSSPALNRPLNFDGKDGRVYRTCQYRSPEEIADSYESRILLLLAELRQVGHRREAYKNRGAAQ